MKVILQTRFTPKSTVYDTDVHAAPAKGEPFSKKVLRWLKPVAHFVEGDITLLKTGSFYPDESRKYQAMLFAGLIGVSTAFGLLFIWIGRKLR